MTVLTRLQPDNAPAAGASGRYCAFLSYSHADEKIAGWLHERIERFRVPPELVGRERGEGIVPRRLRPVFRDRHELAAARDLGAEIEEALAGSRVLIVLCSPAAAASRWVNNEIERYHRLRPTGQVLAAIVAGEPFAADLPGREHEECFPPALKVHYDKRGRATHRRAEPIAADLRDGKDGRRLGFLKIVAGMLGVGLDELVKREAARRQRRMAIITSASIAGMALTSGLAVFAFEKRDEARDQRREAEGLVGFMIGDLRTKLEPIGRLDVLDAVGERALGYYRKQDKLSLSDDSLAQRARALTMMGEIADKRGQLDGALARYKEALAGTAEALRRAPDDPQRLFDHAQSVYWVGSIAIERGRIDEAAARFEEYRQLAAKMVAADPANRKWQLEAVYAAGNLGQVELEQRRYSAAATSLSGSVAATEALAKADPGNAVYHGLLLEGLAFLADANDRAGHLQLAIAGRERQLALLSPDLAKGRPDEELRQKAMITNMALSRLLFQTGKTSPALKHAAEASALGQRLVDLDPTNADWLGRSAATRLNEAALLLRADHMAAAAAAAHDGCSKFQRVAGRDPTVVSWQDGLRTCAALEAELTVLRGDLPGAVALSHDVVNHAQKQAKTNPFAIAEAHKVAGNILSLGRNSNGALAEWRTALALWPKRAETPTQLAERGELLRSTGDRAAGREIAERLATLGYRQSISNSLRR